MFTAHVFGLSFSSESFAAVSRWQRRTARQLGAGDRLPAIQRDGQDLSSLEQSRLEDVNTDWERESRFDDLYSDVTRSTHDDGTGDFGVIIRQAMADDPDVTANQIVAIIREARAEHAREQEMLRR